MPLLLTTILSTCKLEKMMALICFSPTTTSKYTTGGKTVFENATRCENARELGGFKLEKGFFEKH